MVKATNIISDNNISLISKPNEVRVITKEMALKQANRIIGEKINGVSLSSQFHLDSENATIQNYKNQLVWIIPLDYQGIFKYLKQDYVPGYVIVHATDGNKMPTLVSTKKITLSPNGWFKNSILMKAWITSNFGIFETHFEIDDQGTPFWIVSSISRTNFLNSPKVDEVSVINAETGESRNYAPNEIATSAPWIDRIVPEYVAEELISDYGWLNGGWFNQSIIGSKTNVLEPTRYSNAELWFVRINNHNYWFSGLTSVSKSDQSLVGIALMDTITGQTYINDSIIGSDENGAIEAVESALGADSTRWDAKIPQPLKINNEWFWNTTIVSSNNIYQKVAIVKMDDSSKIYFGDSVSNAINKIHSTPSDVNSSDTLVSISRNELLKIQAQVKNLSEQLSKLLK